MAIEKYLAIASLGLFVMFAAEIITLYVYLMDPHYEVEPEPKILMYISIGAAPAMCIAGTAFILAKKYGSKQIGAIIIAGGAVLLVGMAYANTLVQDIDKNYVVFTVEFLPPLFMGVSIPIMGIGAYLFKTKQRPVKEYF